MWVLQHWCTICYNIANGYFCATLRQTCSVSTKLYMSATYPINVADIKVQHCLHFAAAWIVYLGCSFFTPLISIENYQYCSNIVTKFYFVFYIGWRSVQHWNNNITTTLLLQWHHMSIATLLQYCLYNTVTILPVDISVQHCGNVAACQSSYALATSPADVGFFAPLISIENYQYCSNVVTKVYFVFYIGWRSVQHWNNNITPTLLLQRHHLRIATLLQQCYNIAYGYFCATLPQCCSVSIKLRISYISCWCCWYKRATLPQRCGIVNCLLRIPFWTIN